MQYVPNLHLCGGSCVKVTIEQAFLASCGTQRKEMQCVVHEPYKITPFIVCKIQPYMNVHL